MNKPFTLSAIFLSLITLIFSNCRTTQTFKPLDKSLTYRITVETNRFVFTFPKDSFAFLHKEELIKECNDALDYDLKLLKWENFSDIIRVNYHNSRSDLWKYTNTRVSGFADIFKGALWMVCNESAKAPTKHEMMHLLSYKLWGYPVPSSFWMNEGLSTYAANSCSSFTNEQIYSFYLAKSMLLSIDSLSSSFYKNEEMIAYHQSGYIIQWLLEHYSMEKLKQLWQTGFEHFENIYGVSFKQIETDIKRHLTEKYPIPPKINWNVFKEGCK